MEMLKMMPTRYRLDSNETGAVFFEDRLWMMKASVGMCPVRQEIFNPNTGERRIVEGTIPVYHVEAEIKIEPETEHTETDLGKPEDIPAKYCSTSTKIETPIEKQPLSETSTDTFIDPKTGHLIKIKELPEDRENDSFVCFDVLTGEGDQFDSDYLVNPVHVTIIIHPEMRMSGFLAGRCCRKENWENK